jgi:acetolactate synthase-1/2/3 large subunit
MLNETNGVVETNRPEPAAPERRSSMTAALVCAARAIGVTGTLRDPLAAQLAPEWLRTKLPFFDGEGALVGALRYGLRAASLGLVDHNTVRMAIVDEHLRASADSGLSQLVILGAGLDSRAWRIEELSQVSVFEVDHQASQAEKRGRVASLSPKAANVEFVSVDFEADELAPAMLARGFDPSLRSAWVCEGVTPYLDRESIERLLAAVASLSAPGSSLVMSYLAPPENRREATRKSVPNELVRRLGERAKGTLTRAGMAELLARAGFGAEQDLGWEEWVARVPAYAKLPNLLKERLVFAERRKQELLRPRSERPLASIRRISSRPASRRPEPSEAPVSQRPPVEGIAADHLVRAMEDFGVRAAFGVTGGAFGVIFDRLSRSERIQVFHCQHEGSAAYAAMGRAMATEGRELTVCFSTAGPGITNLLTGVAAAFTESVPMLVLTGNSAMSSRNSGALQDAHPGGIDALRMFDSITVANACVTKAEDLIPMFQRFAELALLHRKPVHLNVPIDISAQQLRYVGRAATALQRAALSLPETDALARFLAAERPLVFAGNGVKLSGYQRLLEGVASRHRVPVVVTCHGRGAMAEDHCAFFGTFGFASDGSGREFLERYRPDAVLFLGTGLGEMATSGWSPLLADPAFKIHVDIDASKFNRTYRVESAIENDIEVVLRELDASPKRNGRFPARGRASVVVPSFDFTPSSALVHPGRLFESLSEAMPEDAILFAEPGNSMAWAFRHARLHGRQELVVPLGFAAMGSAIGAAIGAATTGNGRTIVCVAGDCATMMSGNELKTAAEYRIPLKLVIINDGGHGMVQHGSKMVGLDNIDVRFRDIVDFSAYARALGIPSLSVRDQGEWEDLAASSFLTGEGPVIIDVRIDRAVVPPLADRAKILSITDTEVKRRAHG